MVRTGRYSSHESREYPLSSKDRGNKQDNTVIWRDWVWKWIMGQRDIENKDGGENCHTSIQVIFSLLSFQPSVFGNISTNLSARPSIFPADSFSLFFLPQYKGVATQKQSIVTRFWMSEKADFWLCPIPCEVQCVAYVPDVHGVLSQASRCHNPKQGLTLIGEGECSIKQSPRHVKSWLCYCNRHLVLTDERSFLTVVAGFGGWGCHKWEISRQ